MTKKSPWVDPNDAPLIEQNIHDYIISIYRRLTGPLNSVHLVPISPGAEVDRGWDSAVLEVIPLYFQYKLPDYTSRPANSQHEAYKQRKVFRFDDDDGCFHFSLRKMAKSAPKSQHQLMVDMESAGHRVYYVAPTFIDKSRLRSGGYPSYEDKPWIESRHPFYPRGILDHVHSPLFDGLICIPPTMSVSGNPEDHKIFFNIRYEVSLHSEPFTIPVRQLSAVMADHIGDLIRSQTVTAESIDDYVDKFIGLLANDANQANVRAAIFEYFESKISQEEDWRKNKLMMKMRALARITKKLYGIDMLIGAKRE